MLGNRKPRHERGYVCITLPAQTQFCVMSVIDLGMVSRYAIKEAPPAWSCGSHLGIDIQATAVRPNGFPAPRSPG